MEALVLIKHFVKRGLMGNTKGGCFMCFHGTFDISQRSATLKDYLSMTMPYKLWEDMLKDLDKSCLTTHSWKIIEERL